MTTSITGKSEKRDATSTRKRTPKPVEPVTITALCNTCYDVHPVRLTTVRAIQYADMRGTVAGACPVCQREQLHVLIREASDPQRDQDERDAEAKRLAEDVELTWQISELRRLGLRVEHSDDWGAAVTLVRYLSDGEFVLYLCADEWDTVPAVRKLVILKEVRDRFDSPDGVHRWSVHPETDISDPFVGVGWGA